MAGLYELGLLGLWYMVTMTRGLELRHATKSSFSVLKMVGSSCSKQVKKFSYLGMEMFCLTLAMLVGDFVDTRLLQGFTVKMTRSQNMQRRKKSCSFLRSSRLLQLSVLQTKSKTRTWLGPVRGEWSNAGSTNTRRYLNLLSWLRVKNTTCNKMIISHISLNRGRRRGPDVRLSINMVRWSTGVWRD